NIPLTPNGKVDRKSLPGVSGEDLIRREYVGPRNETEEKLAIIWQEVLGVDQVGISDNFFELGGDSMKSIRLLSKVNKVLDLNYKLSDIYSLPSIKELLSIRFERIDHEISLQIKAQVEESFKKLSEELPLDEEVQSVFPMSDIEQGMIYASFMDSEIGVYHDQFLYPIHISDFEQSLFIRAVELLVKKHEILRTAFNINDYSVPVHLIYKNIEIPLDVEDISSKEQKAQSEYINEFMIEERTKNPFDLSKPGLWRMKIYKQRPQQWCLLFQFHHSILDGWSVASFITELNNTYLQLLNNITDVEKLSLSYKDYVFNQNCLKAVGNQYKYWENKLSDYKRLDIFTEEVVSQRFNYVIDGELYEKIQEYSKNNGISLKILNFSAYLYALQMLTYNHDITVGIVTNGRPLSEDGDKILGCFLNTIPFRLVRTNGIISEFVQKINQFVNIQKQFERISLFELNLHFPTHNRGENPFFDTFFNYVDFHIFKELNIQEETPEVEDGQFVGVNFESTNTFLDLSVSPISNGLSISWNQQRLLKGGITVDQLQGYYYNFLNLLVKQPNSSLESQLILTLDESHKLLYEFNDTVCDYPKDSTIVSLFESQVNKTPDHVAVVYDEVSLTYRELNEFSNQLGSYLREHYDTHSEDLVGVKLERSEKIPVVLLGILKSGAAYVPIDPNYPQERIDYIENDSKAKVTIDAFFLESFSKELSLDSERYNKENVPIISKEEDLAYVIYTSGTTGHPKGVMIENRNAVDLIYWAQNEFDLSRFSITYAATSYCFDLSVYEMFYTLSVGKTLRIINNGLEIRNYIEKDDKILINTVPSVVKKLLEEGVSFSTVGILNMAGEPIALDTIDRLDVKNLDVYNLYGPSEDTTYSTYYKIEDKVYSNIPIGRPISNTRAYILDEEKKIVPIGTVGILYLSGSGLSRGYLHKSSLTLEKFIENPFEKAEKMYDTGDLARWLPNGNIEFLGRKDHQVKIRGYRIELGEIESAILMYSDALKDIIVEAKEVNGEKALAAYYTKEEESEIDKTELRKYLQSKLPDYMVPGFFIELDSIPLTPNGKVDRKALPGVSGEDLIRREYVAPRNETEVKLAKIWQEILGVEKIGITDNFFEMGGHSLSATKLISLIHKEFEVKLSLKELFEKIIIEDQAILVEGSFTSNYSSIPLAPLAFSYPLSSSQQRLWILSQFGGGNIAYNIPEFYEFEGVLDTDLLESSFRYLLGRHESLRTVFREEESGEVRQYILPLEEIDFHLAYEDLQGSDPCIVEDILESEKHKAFDLSIGPLLRIRLLQVSSSRYVFSFVLHHIISDAWSMEIMIKELFDYYESNLEGNFVAPAPLSLHYKDYAVWQKSQLEGDSLSAHKSYWRGQFSGELPVLSLPSQYVRPALKTYNGDILIREIPSSSFQNLKSFSYREGSTLFMSLLSVINVLFYRYTGQEDIIIGSAITAREHFDLSDQIGFYINTLPLRSRFSRDESFREVMKVVREMTLSAYAHQSYPLDELIGDLSLKRDMSRNALFDVMVDLQSQAMDPVSSEEEKPFSIKGYEDLGRSISRFDLHFNFSERSEGLSLALTYNSDIYSEAFIVQLLDHFDGLLTQVVAHADVSISKLDYLGLSEKEELLHSFNNTSVEYAGNATIIDLFESQVEKTPDHVAVVYGDIELSYEKLNERANQFAHYLRDKYSIMPDELVGIRMDRSEHLIVVLLGILKSGGAYVPIDSQYPQERIDYMEKDSQCKVVIDEDELILYNFERFRYGTGNVEKVSQPSDLAYIIYTSGSTGAPKGVMVEHGNLYNYLLWGSGYYFRGEGEGNFGLFSSLSFDLTITSIFLPLIRGRFLRVMEADKDVYEMLNAYLSTPGLDTVKLTPSHLELLKDLDLRGSSLRTIIVGGEELLPQHVDKLLGSHQELRIYNEYGPTESTVGCMVKHVEKDALITIGNPISNTRIYILDNTLNLVPAGVTGTLYVSGSGVSRGYLNCEELSVERFISDPFEEGFKMYNTGDLGRWLPNGEIDYLGRKDDQVKIRGYRIELGEVESAVSYFTDNIKQVVAVVKEVNGEKVLAAYYTTDTGSNVDKLLLKEYLQARLPEYMIPRFFIELDSIALTTNGKVDRKALLSFDTKFTSNTKYVAPRNEFEELLVKIWQEIIDVKKISAEDDFFNLGGHSLLVIKLSNLIHKSFEIKLTMNELFQNPTLESQALLIENLFIVKENILGEEIFKDSGEIEDYTI
ncbi:amino acid adenylation domain-containing protein, partial [Chryseobacterium sp. SIMBA_029]|uniref:amino acid adenylation domain-containing protein n=3 Tax=Bacteria TaxID=2 RepID=UPI003979C21D